MASLAAVGVVGQRAQQSRHERSPEIGLFGDERVGHPHGRTASVPPGDAPPRRRRCWSTPRKPRCRHSTLLTRRRDRCSDGEMARLRPGRRVAGDVGVPEHPGHLLDDVVDPVGGRAHVGPVGRHQRQSSVRPPSLAAGRGEPDRVRAARRCPPRSAAPRSGAAPGRWARCRS